MLGRCLVVLVSAAPLLAGCGDDDGAVSTANRQEGVSTASDQESADEAIAALERSLRDQGFSATTDEDDGDLVYESEECRAFEEEMPDQDDALAGQTARADSEGFERGDVAPGAGVLEEVGATAWLVEKAEDLNPVLELLNQHVGRCLEEAFRIEIESAAPEDEAPAVFGEIEVEIEAEELGSQGLGDAGGGVELTGEVTISGNTFPVSLAAQYVRADRALVLIDVFAVGPDQPTVDRTALLQVLVDGATGRST